MKNNKSWIKPAILSELLSFFLIQFPVSKNRSQISSSTYVLKELAPAMQLRVFNSKGHHGYYFTICKKACKTSVTFQPLIILSLFSMKPKHNFR